MKTVYLVILAALISGCGTVGGTFTGAGEDLRRAGEWIKSR